MTNPRLLTIPFADTGTKNEIPVSGAIEPQLATFQAGFPVITQQKIANGGIPPERADFNGILNIYGQHIVHLNKGMPYEFDQDFANAIGGYPLHARIMLSDGQIAQNTIDGNTSNPNLAGTGWLIGISASLVKNANGETQQKINDYIGVNWYAKSGGYALGDRVRLLTGEIVQSTVNANTNNPNVDMTGWVKDNSASQIVDASAKSQQLINDLNKPIELFYAVGGSLTPVSDLYTAGAIAFTPSKFKNFSDVQAYFPHVTATTDPLDWAAAQKSLNSEGYINFSSKQYFFGDKTLIIPTTGFRIEGKGYSTRINTIAATAIKVADGTRLTNGFFGKFYLLGSNVVGSVGWDASAMAYCTFQNILIRQFGDGWFADGSLNPVNKQYSNNTIINVRSNNNLRYGFYFDGDEYANSANTYIGCESAGNGSIGFYENVGYSNQTVGCTFQGNPIDFLSNGTRNIHQFYTEINAKSVRFGQNSIGNELSIRSTFPLWNCVIDDGKQNKISNRGEETAIKYLFDNPNFTNWSAANPNNVAKNGSIVWGYFVDTSLRYGGGLQATVNADYQGIILNGLGSAADLNHAWVTVQIDADTSGMTDLSQFRIYCRDGSTNNSTNGEFFVGSWTKTTAGVYKRFTADIRFPVGLVGAPSILIYPVHTGNTASNVLKIKSIQVVSGQYFKLDPAPATEFVKSATSAILLDQTNGINIAFKFAGKVVHNSTLGVPMVARGSAASSVWEFMADRYVTTTALSSATDAVNTQFKTIGGQVYNTTDSKKYYATGTGSASNWKSTDGATTITPA